jgi:hypothetical protein
MSSAFEDYQVRGALGRGFRLQTSAVWSNSIEGRVYIGFPSKVE